MIECLEYKKFQKGNFLGFASIYVEKWGVIINNISVFKKDGGRWINFPSKEYTNKEGEKKYMPLIRFKEREHMDAFSDVVKQAIDEWCQKNPEPKPPPQTQHYQEEIPF